MSASYGDAPGDVIAALLEAADCVPAVEKQPAPDAYITGFKDFCIDYVLRFWSKHYEHRHVDRRRRDADDLVQVHIAGGSRSPSP